MEVTRFAPSPTGLLHLGHAHAALFAAAQGRLLVRIEDIDATRCRAEFIDAILADLRWLGLDFAEPVRRQSQHLPEYAAALTQLQARGVLYPCFCTRAEIQAEVQRAGGAPHGPEGALYPGSCRHLSPAERALRLARGASYALRLDCAAALRQVGGAALTFHDRQRGTTAADPLSLGDVVLARKEVPASYHLCVTLDDARQGVTLVTRGEDLFHATHVQRLLQALLGLAVPEYHHHRLLTDERGARFAKRDKALTLQALRQAGVSPAEVRRRAGW